MLIYLRNSIDFHEALAQAEHENASDRITIMEQETQKVRRWLDALERIVKRHGRDHGFSRASQDLDLSQRLIDSMEYGGTSFSADLWVMPSNAKEKVSDTVIVGDANNAAFKWTKRRLTSVYDFIALTGPVTHAKNYMKYDNGVIKYMTERGILDSLLTDLECPLSLFQHDYLHPLTNTFSSNGTALEGMVEDGITGFRGHFKESAWTNVLEVEVWVTQLHRMVIEEALNDADHEAIVSAAQHYFNILAQDQKAVFTPKPGTLRHAYYEYMAMQFLWPLTVVFPPDSPILRQCIEASFCVDYPRIKEQDPVPAVLAEIAANTGHVYNFVHNQFPHVRTTRDSEDISVHALDEFLYLMGCYDHAWKHVDYGDDPSVLKLMPRSMRKLRGITLDPNGQVIQSPTQKESRSPV